MTILYATVCRRYQLLDEMVEACMESSPYSERAINIMKVGKQKVTPKLEGLLKRGIGSSLKDEKEM